MGAQLLVSELTHSIWPPQPFLGLWNMMVTIQLFQTIPRPVLSLLLGLSHQMLVLEMLQPLHQPVSLQHLAEQALSHMGPALHPEDAVIVELGRVGFFAQWLVALSLFLLATDIFGTLIV